MAVSRRLGTITVTLFVGCRGREAMLKLNIIYCLAVDYCVAGLKIVVICGDKERKPTEFQIKLAVAR